MNPQEAHQEISTAIAAATESTLSDEGIAWLLAWCHDTFKEDIMDTNKQPTEQAPLDPSALALQAACEVLRGFPDDIFFPLALGFLISETAPPRSRLEAVSVGLTDEDGAPTTTKVLEASEKELRRRLRKLGS